VCPVSGNEYYVTTTLRIARGINRGMTSVRLPTSCEDEPVTRQFSSGGERTRTADFHVANVALYQLSYTPGETGAGCSGPASAARSDDDSG
jgi:hypothetical protein